MNLDVALRPLAVSLSQVAWTAEAIERHLLARLPRGQERLARSVTGWLVRQFQGGVAPDMGTILQSLRDTTLADRLLKLARKAGHPPALPLTPPRFVPDPRLPDLGLPVLETVDALADWMAITPEQLVCFADLRGLSANCPSPFAPHYRHHLLPKRDGSLRLIEEPRPFLKRLQRRVLTGLLAQVPPHPAAFAFVRGRGCIPAAARHSGEAVVLGFDLRHFFATVDLARVHAIFRTLGYPTAVARALAGLCTAITPLTVLADTRIAGRDVLAARHLPQGAPTSPALANLAARAMDRRLAGLARSIGAAYTRYADDMTFSGDAVVAGTLARAVPDVVAQEGWHLNPAKTRVMRRGGRQVVTGLTVNTHVNVARADWDRLKATIHHLRDPADPRRGDRAFLSALSGRIAWVEQANPHRGTRLRLALDALTLPA
jgi:hypothetical protein